MQVTLHYEDPGGVYKVQLIGIRSDLESTAKKYKPMKGGLGPLDRNYLFY